MQIAKALPGQTFKIDDTKTYEADEWGYVQVANQHVHILRQFGVKFVVNAENKFLPPDESQDASRGYEKGSVWAQNDGKFYRCVDATPGKAQWVKLDEIPPEFKDPTQAENTATSTDTREKTVSTVEVESTDFATIAAGREAIATKPTATPTPAPAPSSPPVEPQSPHANAGGDDQGKPGETTAPLDAGGKAEGGDAAQQAPKADAA